MSFRQFGGINYAPKHNIVTSNYNTSNNLLVTQNVGQPNSYINFLSDISGNIKIYGNVDISGNLTVKEDIDCSGSLYVQDNATIYGNLTVKEDIDCIGSLYVQDNATIYGNLTVKEDIDCSSSLYVQDNATIYGNLTVKEDIDCSGSIFVNNSSNNGNIYVGPLNTGLSLQSYVASSYIRNSYNPNGVLYIGSGQTNDNTLTLRTGKLGINIDPNYSLDISGNINLSGSLLQNGSPYPGITQWLDSGSNIYFNTGNVGIGKIPGNYALDVNGNINLSGSLLQNGSPYPGITQWLNSGSNIYFNTGNVGIGKTPGNYALDVNGNINTSSLYFNSNTSQYLTYITGNTIGYYASGNHNFYINNNEIGRFTSKGLGIYNTNPQCPLDVVGTINIRQSVNGNYYSSFYIDTSSNNTVITTNSTGSGEIDLITGNIIPGAIPIVNIKGTTNTSLILQETTNNYSSTIASYSGALNITNNTSGGFMYFNTSGGNMTFDSSGRLGINKTPSYTLDVSGNANFDGGTIYVSSSNTSLIQSIDDALYILNNYSASDGLGTIYLGYNNVNKVSISSFGLTVNSSDKSLPYASSFIVDGCGNTVITTNNSGTNTIYFQTNGADGVYISGAGVLTASSFNATSDYRLKTNIKQLNDNYTVDVLKPIEYDINDNHDIGFLAHEVQEYYPFLVNGEKDGEQMQSINYNGFIALLVKEIKDLKKKQKELEDKLSKL